MVESLEQVLDQHGFKLSAKARQNALYRQCLKIHRFFLLRAEALRPQMRLLDPMAPPRLPQNVQFELLQETLEEQGAAKARKQRLAQGNYARCVMQKGFIALLTNMMEQVAENSQVQDPRRRPQTFEASQQAPIDTISALNTVTPPSNRTPGSMRANATFGGQRSILQQPSKSTFEITDDFPAHSGLDE